MRATMFCFVFLISISGISVNAAEKSFIVGDSYINNKSDLKKYSLHGFPIGTEINKSFESLKYLYPNAYAATDSVLLIPKVRLGQDQYTLRVVWNSSLATHPMEEFCYEKDYSQDVRPASVAKALHSLESIFMKLYGKPGYVNKKGINIYAIGMNPTFYTRRTDGIDIAVDIYVKIEDKGKIRLTGCIISLEMMRKEAERYNQLIDEKKALEDQIERHTN